MVYKYLIFFQLLYFKKLIFMNKMIIIVLTAATTTLIFKYPFNMNLYGKHFRYVTMIALVIIHVYKSRQCVDKIKVHLESELSSSWRMSKIQCPENIVNKCKITNKTWIIQEYWYWCFYDSNNSAQIGNIKNMRNMTM